MSDPDIIDTLAGLAPDSPLAQIRDRRPVTREHAQSSLRALFEPAEPGRSRCRSGLIALPALSPVCRPQETSRVLHRRLLRTTPAEGFVAALFAEIDRGRTVGPYGAYPNGPLTVEDVRTGLPGVHRGRHDCSVLGGRLSAAFAHVHMLVFHPRDASPATLQALLDAGWSNTDIVTLSGLVAFLAFQIRAIAGLRLAVADA